MPLALPLMTEPCTLPHIVNLQKQNNNSNNKLLWNTEYALKYGFVNVWKSSSFFSLSFLEESVNHLADTGYCPQNWFSISKCLLGPWLFKIKTTFPSFPFGYVFQSYCCVTNYPKTLRLKTTFLLCSQVLWVRIWGTASQNRLLLVILTWFLSKQSQTHPDSRGGELRFQPLMGEWQGHTLEEHKGQEVFLITFGKRNPASITNVAILTKFWPREYTRNWCV